MIESFLKLHSNPARPLGLAYSGGADSRYLLERLLPFQGTFYSCLHLLHVDHSLRPSSGLEAKEAERVAKAYGLPFHRENLDPKALTGNIEAACRARRYSFFEEVAKKEGLQAVCTAHHADDQAETALKNVLETGRLDRLRGMKPLSKWGNLNVWRPLLKVRKNLIVLYLREYRLPWFEDETNESPALLRGRMRSEIFPYLQTSFGKSVQKPLLRLAEEAAEFSAWIEEKTGPYLSEICPGVVRILGPFDDPFLLKYVLRAACPSFSEEEEKEAIGHLVKGSANCWINKVYLDRRVLFFRGLEGNGWTFSRGEASLKPHWEEYLCGSATVKAPFEVERVIELQEFEGSEFHRRVRDNLSKAKVPHLLWPRLPLILSRAGDAYEPLTETLSTPLNQEGYNLFYQLRR